MYRVTNILMICNFSL